MPGTTKTLDPRVSCSTHAAKCELTKNKSDSEVQFLSHTSRIPRAQQPHLAMGALLDSTQGAVPTSQEVLLDRAASDPSSSFQNNSSVSTLNLLAVTLLNIKDQT